MAACPFTVFNVEPEEFLINRILSGVAWNLPVEPTIFAFSTAVSEFPHLNEILVALEEAEKSPSDTASIAAQTRIASVPVPSSGAWN